MAWGLSPLEDQQLAGLLMMTVGSMMYVVATVILVGVWLGVSEKTGMTPNGFGSKATRKGPT